MKKRVSPLNKTASLHRKIIADSSPNSKLSFKKNLNSTNSSLTVPKTAASNIVRPQI